MASIVKISRKHQVVVPREAREALGVGAGDELVVEVENGKVTIKPRPRSYSRLMLGLHGAVWKGVKTEGYVKAERKAWQKELPQSPEQAQDLRHRYFAVHLPFRETSSLLLTHHQAI